MIDMTKLHAQVKRLLVPEGTHKQSTLQSLREGLAYVRRTPSVLLIIVVIGVISLFGINFNVVLPLFATNVSECWTSRVWLHLIGLWPGFTHLCPLVSMEQS